jgi:LPS-assembly protein
LLPAFLFFFLFFQQPQDEVTIDALGNQSLEGDVVTVENNVVITYQDIRIEADKVIYNDKTKDVHAEDHVVFIRGGERLESETVDLNLTTKTGLLINARGAVGPGYFITAAEARRLEDGSYELRSASITTCDNLKPGWVFVSGHARIHPDEKVTAAGSVFKLQSVPLFYLPYMIVPTGRQGRSTGFLIPSTSTSTTKGRSVRESFYYAINRSADATFTGEYFSKRGLFASVNFRAVPNSTSSIDVTGSFAHDRKGQGGQSARILTFTDFGKDVRGVADMNLVSSFVYRQVYEEGFNIISSPVEHSLAFVTKNQPRVSYNLLYSRTGIFFTDQPSVAIRKFPTLELNLSEQRVSKGIRLPLYVSLNTGISGVARRDADIKTSTYVQRLDVHPSLEVSALRIAALNWNHRFGIRETGYTDSRSETPGRDALNRFSFDYTSVFAGPRLERDAGSWRHVVEPRVEYHFVRGADRFRKGIIVDDVDLVTNANEVEYGIVNRFFTNREVFSWQISQKYFFDPTFGGALVPGRRNVFEPLLDLTGFAFADGLRRFTPIVSRMRISTSAATSTDIQVDYDTKAGVFRSAGIIGGLTVRQGVVDLAYFFTRRSVLEEPNNQIRATVAYGGETKPGFSAALNFSYDIHRSLFQGSILQVGYNTDCYGLNLEFIQFDVGARKESQVRFAFSLKNIGSYGSMRRQERLF